jgi:hypothetical protein
MFIGCLDCSYHTPQFVEECIKSIHDHVQRRYGKPKVVREGNLLRFYVGETLRGQFRLTGKD